MTDRVFLRVNDVVLVNSETVNPPPPNPPPNPPPPPPPVTPTDKPHPISWLSGGNLTGTMGNPIPANGIPGDHVVSYYYAFAPSDQGLTFSAAGQSIDGIPPWTWAWLARNYDGSGEVTTPVRYSGSNVANVADVQVAALRAQGLAGVFFCEQPSAPGSWNRYAQVNPGAVIAPPRGR